MKPRKVGFQDRVLSTVPESSMLTDRKNAKAPKDSAL